MVSVENNRRKICHIIWFKKRMHYHHSSPCSKQLFLFSLCHKQHRTVQFASTFPLRCPVPAETAEFSFMFYKTVTVFKVLSFVEKEKKRAFLYSRAVRDFICVMCRSACLRSPISAFESFDGQRT